MNRRMVTAALLDLLDVTGHTLTIDAMGCQRSIAKKIRDKGATSAWAKLPRLWGPL